MVVQFWSNFDSRCAPLWLSQKEDKYRELIHKLYSEIIGGGDVVLYAVLLTTKLLCATLQGGQNEGQNRIFNVGSEIDRGSLLSSDGF